MASIWDPLTPRKPTCATNGTRPLPIGDAHDLLPRTTHAAFATGGGPWISCCWRRSSALMLAGVILSLAASPPVATRIGLDPFHFFNRHVLFLAAVA